MNSSLGTRLRMERERQGLSLSAIADETKINMVLLEGLERDDVSRWPGGLYRRAYIRAYARAAGLDPEPIVREFIERYPDPVEVEAAEQAKTAAEEARRRWFGGLSVWRRGLEILQRDRRTQAPPEYLPAVTSQSADDGAADAAEAPPPANVVSLPSEILEVRQIRLKIPETRPRAAVRRERVGLERDLVCLARVCATLGCAGDREAVRAALEDGARILGAQSVVVWIWDAARAVLCPAIAHGYPDQALTRLASLARHPDSAIASAFRTTQVTVVDRGRRTTGAVVTPLLAPAGCVGVLALEFRNGAEQRESTRAFAVLLGAQLATLLPGSSGEDVSKRHAHSC